MPTIKLPGKRRKFHKLETDAKGNNKITTLTYHYSLFKEVNAHIRS